jgi:Rrf2 family nitric oxide-sensitive transcriptional repressor
MRLTIYTDFSLRSLIFLGVHRDESVTIPDIATAFDISEHHLRKVVHRLGQIGLVETTRGRNGGLRLAKNPEEISVGAVVRLMEEDFAMVQCFGDGNCRIAGVCTLQGILAEAMSAWFAVLDRYTLADAIKNPKALLRRLGLPSPAAA